MQFKNWDIIYKKKQEDYKRWKEKGRTASEPWDPKKQQLVSLGIFFLSHTFQTWSLGSQQTQKWQGSREEKKPQY